MIDRTSPVSSANAIVEQIGIALRRVRAGRSAKNFLLAGQNGAGKTITLREISINAHTADFITINIAASEHSSLPCALIEPMYAALLQLRCMETAGPKTERCQRILGSFTTTVASDGGGNYPDLGLELGVADNRNLDGDLRDLLLAVGEACRECGTAAVLLVDDLHFVADEQLSALLGAFHQCAQRASSIILVGTGSPQLTGQVARVKPYSERMFELHQLT